MIEYVFLVQLTTAQPQPQEQVPQSTYQAPKYETQSAPSYSSVPSSKKIEEFEERLFDHPN